MKKRTTSWRLKISGKDLNRVVMTVLRLLTRVISLRGRNTLSILKTLKKLILLFTKRLSML